MWTKCAARRALSRKIRQTIKTVIDESDPARRLQDIMNDVAFKVNKPLDRGSARIFFHTELQKALRKRQRRQRRKPTRWHTWSEAGLHPSVDTCHMWNNDDWRYKHELMTSRAITHHNKNLKKLAVNVSNAA